MKIFMMYDGAVISTDARETKAMFIAEDTTWGGKVQHSGKTKFYKNEVSTDKKAAVERYYEMVDREYVRSFDRLKIAEKTLKKATALRKRVCGK